MAPQSSKFISELECVNSIFLFNDLGKQVCLLMINQLMLQVCLFEYIVLCRALIQLYFFVFCVQLLTGWCGLLLLVLLICLY